MNHETADRVAADPGPSVRIYHPDERLRSFVTFYYFVDCEHPLRDFLYPEWGNVRFSIRGAWYMRLGDNYPDTRLDTPLFGPTDQAAELSSPGGKTVGFGLTPLGWERFLDMPADSLANRVCDVGDRFGIPAKTVQAALTGHDSDEQGVALFDAMLLDQLALRPPNSALAIRIDSVLRDRPPSVEVFAAAIGISPRRLGLACRRVFGFGPKRLLRRQRFLDTLGNIRVTDKPEFTALIDPEYFDQSHFNREFREFMGLSPSEYLGAPRPLMAHAAQVQAEVGIPLSFRLPPQDI